MPRRRRSGRRVDPLGAGAGGLNARTAETLAAAAIPATKLGGARGARLAAGERELYHWILRRFAERGRPASGEVRAEAARLQLDADGALAALARENLVHLDHEGEIAVAYPFSGRPTDHVVRFPGGHAAYAMCAIDAVGIAPMFATEVTVASRDPISGGTVAVRVTSAGAADWTPVSAVVVAGAPAGDGDSCTLCCPVVNFFVSAETACRWLDERPHVRGRLITVPDAVEAGRVVFGGVLAVSPPLPPTDGGAGRPRPTPPRGRRAARAA